VFAAVALVLFGEERDGEGHEEDRGVQEEGGGLLDQPIQTADQSL
jgi:hypothetical protein